VKEKIHVWHLEIVDTAQVPKDFSRADYELTRLTDPSPDFARYLYIAVGAPWVWYMRVDWTWDQWQKRLRNTKVEFWVANIDGAPIGFFELQKQARGSVEIAYFGLIPQYIGKGHGKKLLEDAIHAAWNLGGRRVWLHTCSLDHPNALSNYQSRGFSVFKEEYLTDNIPDEPIQPWLGANKSL
jgi:N-acetylglutamate synthase-like GNAT family acetyltransferase